MTIIESLYCGTIPIIATSINTKLMIDDRVNGILYDSNDPTGLENALAYFDSLNIYAKRKMSNEAINKFYAMYSENVHFDKIKEIYFC